MRNHRSMYKFLLIRSTRGVALIDALVALAVLAIGLLALAQFQGGMLASSSLSKARSEAVQLAEDKIEELRNLAVVGQYTAIASGNDAAAIPGINTSFTRSWQVTGTPKEVLVTVAWTDPKEGAQEVNLTTTFAWDNPLLSANIGAGGVPGVGALRTPTGSARMGDKTYTELPAGDPIMDTSPNDANRGRIWDTVNAETGERELIYEVALGEYRVVLIGDNAEDAFSTISGNVYLDEAAFNNRLPDVSKIFVLSSDAVFCTPPSGDLQDEPEGTPAYKYFSYTCFVGKGWYGNIGIVRTENTGSSERVCLGDPAVGSWDPVDGYGNEISTSEHPVLANIREYRGYKEVVDAVSGVTSTVSVGIGSGVPDGNGGGSLSAEDPADWNYVAQTYTGQDFLLTSFNQPDDQKCQVHEVLSPDNPFAGNTGDFVCLTDPNGAVVGGYCPSTLPTGEPPITTISGTIHNSESANVDVPLLSAITLEGGECETLPPPSNGGHEYLYTCRIDWRGWTGEVGTSFLTVTPDPADPNGSSEVAAIDTGTCTIDGIACGGTDVVISVRDMTPENNTIIDFEGITPAIVDFHLDFTLTYP